MEPTQTQKNTDMVRIFYTRAIFDRVLPERHGRLRDITFPYYGPQATPTREEFARFYTKVFDFGELTFFGSHKELAEELFAKFNDYEKNPLSAESNGQWRVREAGAGHTSMSVGDIVVIGTKPYIVRGQGFEALSFEVEA